MKRMFLVVAFFAVVLCGTLQADDITITNLTLTQNCPYVRGSDLDEPYPFSILNLTLSGSCTGTKYIGLYFFLDWGGGLCWSEYYYTDGTVSGSFSGITRGINIVPDCSWIQDNPNWKVVATLQTSTTCSTSGCMPSSYTDYAIWNFNGPSHFSARACGAPGTPTITYQDEYVIDVETTEPSNLGSCGDWGYYYWFVNGTLKDSTGYDTEWTYEDYTAGQQIRVRLGNPDLAHAGPLSSALTIPAYVSVPRPTVSSITHESAVLNWSSISGATSIRVRLRESEGTYSTYATLAGTATTCTLTSLNPSTTYNTYLQAQVSGTWHDGSARTFTTENEPAVPVLGFRSEVIGNIELGDTTRIRLIFENSGTGSSLPDSFFAYIYGSRNDTGPWLYVSTKIISIPAITAGNACTLVVAAPWGTTTLGPYTVCTFDDPPIDRNNWFKIEIYNRSFDLLFTAYDDAFTTWGGDLRTDMTFWIFNTLALAFGIPADATLAANFYSRSMLMAHCLDEGDYGCAGSNFVAIGLSVAEHIGGMPIAVLNSAMTGTCFIQWFASQGYRTLEFMGSVWRALSGGRSVDLVFSGASLTPIDTSECNLDSVELFGMWNDGDLQAGWFYAIRWSVLGDVLFAELIRDANDSTSPPIERYLVSSYSDSIIIQTPTIDVISTVVFGNDSALYYFADTIIGGDTVFITFDSLAVAVEDIEKFQIAGFSIWSLPNPFNSALSISTPDMASVEIFDIMGKSIATLKGGEQVWRPDNSVGSGVYLVRASVGPSTGSGTKSITKRVVYLK